jgi:hypothetical protein
MRGSWYIVTDLDSGITFHFAMDRQQPTRLHIEAAHGATPQDAIRTFFDPRASGQYDAPHQRYERWSGGWLVAWLWMDEPERRNVLIITCLPKGEIPWQTEN